MSCFCNSHPAKTVPGPGMAFGILLLCLAAGESEARKHNELLLLPAVGHIRSEPAPGDNGNNGDTQASLDILYAIDYGQFRFFSEFILMDTDNDVDSDLSRLHIGWESSHGTTVWLGRFQAKQGYWNKTFHFRNYIQPTILAPGLAAYENEGGALPTHYSGIAARHQWTLKQASTLRLEAGFGSGDKFDSRLKAHDLLDPDGGRKPAASIRIAYTPDQDSNNEVGLFYASNRIVMKTALYSQNNQRVAGGYLNWQSGALRMIGALYRVSDDLKTTSGRSRQRFTSGYLQGQYRIGENWLPYLRLENSHGEKDDPYVALFPGFVRKRALAGVRWGLLGNQALKLEYAKTDFLDQDTNQWAVQWSMIIP